MTTALSYTREYNHMQKQSRRHSVQVETTLYDLIGAVSDQARPGEEHLVAPAVVHLLRDCTAEFSFSGPAASAKNSLPVRKNSCVAM
jgi:hypothetical protein